MQASVQDRQVVMSAIDQTTGGGDAYPDGLTKREMQVLRLVAGGKRNRDIAAELAISTNTVDRHVSSILKKTGSANRTEAAMYAARRGLVL
jgi:DNA-binding NarL/FixJ family response regulator